MNKNYEAMSTATQRLLEYLKKEGYSENTIGKYRTTFNSIITFSSGKSDYVFDSEQCSLYVSALMDGREYSALPRSCQNKIRCANTLLEFQLTGHIFFRKNFKPQDTETGPLFDVLDQYLSYKESIGYREYTLYAHKKCLSQFCHLLDGLGYRDFSKISVNEIQKYLNSLSFYKKSSISSSLAPLRSFFHYLNDQGLTAIDYAYLVPGDPAPRKAKLPSHYSQDEIAAILDTIDRANPKGRRNYAIILLIAETGLRASDVVLLKLEDICWEKSQISIEQFKTKNDVTLPILPNVGNAIIEYLRDGRPKSELRNVFLRLAPPYLPLTTHQICNIVSEYIQKSGVNKNVPSRRHGSHALRHSLAGRMLENNEPLPVISSVLGHKSSESTAFYLGIDHQSLSKCSLEVPICTAYEED